MSISSDAIEAASKAFGGGCLSLRDNASELERTAQHSLALMEALKAAAPHMFAGVYALMEDPEHYDSQGPSSGYVSVDNLRAALDATP